MTQHIKIDQLGQKFKIEFLLFPKRLFFEFNFGAKVSEIMQILQSQDIIISLMTSKQIGEKLILRKSSQHLGIWAKCWHTIAIQKSIFTWKHCFYRSNPSSNLESKHWRFQNTSNLKINLRQYFEIFWSCSPITKNWIFWQLVLFNMLSQEHLL